MSARIDCGLSNGIEGERAATLILCEARDAFAGESGEQLVPALTTNAGPMGIDTSDAEEIALAAKILACDPAAIRSAVVAALPEADGWDWASP